MLCCHWTFLCSDFLQPGTKTNWVSQKGLFSITVEGGIPVHVFQYTPKLLVSLDSLETRGGFPICWGAGPAELGAPRQLNPRGIEHPKRDNLKRTTFASQRGISACPARRSSPRGHGFGFPVCSGLHRGWNSYVSYLGHLLLLQGALVLRSAKWGGGGGVGSCLCARSMWGPWTTWADPTNPTAARGKAKLVGITQQTHQRDGPNFPGSRQIRSGSNEMMFSCRSRKNNLNWVFGPILEASTRHPPTQKNIGKDQHSTGPGVGLSPPNAAFSAWKDYNMLGSCNVDVTAVSIESR